MRLWDDAGETSDEVNLDIASYLWNILLGDQLNDLLRYQATNKVGGRGQVGGRGSRTIKPVKHESARKGMPVIKKKLTFPPYKLQSLRLRLPRLLTVGGLVH